MDTHERITMHIHQKVCCCQGLQALLSADSQVAGCSDGNVHRYSLRFILILSLHHLRAYNFFFTKGHNHYYGVVHKNWYN
jgi:hypothetical protein